MADEKTKSKMSYDEKVKAATAVLKNNGYTEKEIAEILKMSFGEKPKKK